MHKTAATIEGKHNTLSVHQQYYCRLARTTKRRRLKVNSCMYVQRLDGCKKHLTVDKNYMREMDTELVYYMYEGIFRDLCRHDKMEERRGDKPHAVYHTKGQCSVTSVLL